LITERFGKISQATRGGKMSDYTKAKFIPEGEYTQDDIDDCYETRLVPGVGIWLFYSHEQLVEWTG
jgi:hypothetical protein